MKKLVLMACLVGVVVLVSAVPSEARGRGWHRGSGVRTSVVLGFGVGPVFWPRPYWYHPWPYYAYAPPYYAYAPPTVIVREPPVYIEQPAPAPAPPPATPQSYWHYCPSARAYYPTVSTCPEPWMKVPPRPE